MTIAQSVFRYVSIGVAIAALAACASNDKLPPAPGSISGKAQTPGTGSNPYGAASPHRKVGNPYKVAGIWYYPKEEPDYSKQGIASWYGPKFHGRKTSNGEIFDMNRLTAAHPTLPLPSIVRVTNLENGRTIDLRLNDRGPFAHGRVIDLSRAAAEKLGYRETGLANVRVQYISPASLDDAVLALGEPEAYATGRLARVTYSASQQANPQYDTVKTRIATGPEITVSQPLAKAEDMNGALMKDARASVVKAERMVVETVVPSRIASTSPSIKPTAGIAQNKPVFPTRVSVPTSTNTEITSGTWLVQVAAFSSRENADRSLGRFDSTVPVRTVREPRAGGDWLYKIRLGPYQTNAEAEKARLIAVNAGFSDARIVRF